MFDETKKPKNKYDTPVLFERGNEEIEFDRMILNLDVDLIEDIDEHVHNLKKAGLKIKDLKTGKMKKVNKSSWAREVFAEALKREQASTKKS